jgi:hypothetical protein
MSQSLCFHREVVIPQRLKSCVRTPEFGKVEERTADPSTNFGDKVQSPVFSRPVPVTLKRVVPLLSLFDGAERCASTCIGINARE